jgi:sporulation protein YlmC with PRC-barrel domain
LSCSAQGRARVTYHRHISRSKSRQWPILLSDIRCARRAQLVGNNLWVVTFLQLQSPMAAPMFAHLPKVVLIILSLIVAGAAYAQPGKVDLEAAEMVAELIGAPVLARDGEEVGVVADISFDADLQPLRLRMTTGQSLGLGARTIEVPKGTFKPVRGAVLLTVSAEAVSAFAELAEPNDEK